MKPRISESNTFKSQKTRSVDRVIQSNLLNHSGFTLMESMIALGIAGVAILIASSMLVNSSRDNIANTGRNEAETSASLAEMYLRNYLGQAVDMLYAGNANLDAANPIEGQIRNYDSLDPTNLPTPNALALFQREVGGRIALPFRQSLFNATGIYFITPTASTSGVLFFASSAVSDTVGPSYSVPFVGDLVEFQVKNVYSMRWPGDGSPSLLPGSPVSAADFRMVFRYFEPGPAKKVWCPGPGFASSACAAVPHRSFHDVTKIVTVVFRNNADSSYYGGGGGYNRPLGKLYFFPMFNKTN